eukprot:gene2813-5656_t
MDLNPSANPAFVNQMLKFGLMLLSLTRPASKFELSFFSRLTFTTVPITAPSQPNPTPENFIKISTRIKDSWCEFPPEILEKYKYKGNATFVFIVSNGHTGTTFLGQQMNWRLAFGRVPKGFIVVHENEPDKAFLKHLAFSNEYCNEALEYVYNQKLPFMLRALDKQNAHTYFAAGHQIILGILPALADILGHRAKFVRLRRSRLDTAYSFFQKRVGPCHKLCIYCICPLDPIARCPITSSVLWNQLNTFQQYLWAVDEVECQWQSLMNARPEIEYMELNWKDSLPTSAMQQLANFIGMPELTPKTAEVAGTNRHVKPDKKGQKNMTLLNHWAADYDKLLGFRQCNAFTCILNVKDN